MTTMKPVSRTAYYCCGVRALDAAVARPVCGDTYADRFMTPEAWSLFEPFRGFAGPNASNVTRHRLIDDVLRAAVQSRPETCVVIIGAGFDTRAFRLPGGRWVELDEPAIIAVKETHLPASDAPNPLTRVAIAFGHDPLAAALTPFCDHLKPVVVLEGVFSYLSAAELRGLLEVIRATFAHPTIVCDLTTLAFARRHGGKIGKQLRELGAPYGRLEVEPLEVFQAAGFRLTSRQSIVGRAVSMGLLRIPSWLLATVLRSLRDGYTIATFEPTALS
jgi:methyltransferase (TIGR00027 family)